MQPRVRKEITQEYSQGVRGRGYLAIAKKHQLPVVTVRHVIARAKLAGDGKVVSRLVIWSSGADGCLCKTCIYQGSWHVPAPLSFSLFLFAFRSVNHNVCVKFSKIPYHVDGERKQAAI